MTEMRPDPDSDLAGVTSEYGDDTGFAAEATRADSAGTTDSGTTDSGTADSGTTDSGTADSGTTDSGTTDPGTTDPGTLADAGETEDTTIAAGPGDGAD